MATAVLLLALGQPAMADMLPAGTPPHGAPGEDLSGRVVRIDGATTARTLSDKLAAAIELEDFGGQADAAIDQARDGVATTDNLPAWNAAVRATAQRDVALSCEPIRLRAGHYYFSGPIVADFSRSKPVYGCAPSIVGAGANATFLHFGNGADGLSYTGNMSIGSGVEIGGFTVVKGGYAGNPYGDLTGKGVTIANLPHGRLHDVKAIQWQDGFSLEDMQEFTAENIEARFNTYGLRAAVGAAKASRPNAIQFINAKFGNNFANCADIANPAAVVFLGGSCEGTSPQGHKVPAGDQFGIRFRFTDAVVEGTAGATLIGFYAENNVGPTFVYDNHFAPSTLVVMGSTVQRHQNDAAIRSPVIRFDTAGHRKQSLVLVGNGMRGFGDYKPDASSPYVEIVNPADDPTIADIGNVWGDRQEAPPHPLTTNPALADTTSYAGDAAAAAAGVALNAYYRSGSAVMIRVK